ncbi:MAG: T9SS type A sorting domain-containing protein [Vicingaceae bacterium]|nr:T9SS type A sorting domain-containing protein [Vicingaceae bacterium]
MRYLALILFFFFVLKIVCAQKKNTVNIQRIAVEKDCVVEPALIPDSYDALLFNLEAPSPDGNSVKSHLLRQKMKQKELYPIKNDVKNKVSSSALKPSIGQEFPLLRYVGSLVIDLNGGLPNDNTLAVSNGGIVLTGMNSFVFAYDLIQDTAIFPNFSISLKNMANGNIGQNYYDPKLIYDKNKDRFILVFLQDTDPSTNKIVVCFSTSNDPNDPWNVYRLPGNPLNNNRWTDFPAIAITETDLFITGNLIVPNVSWQVGFDGSVVWQIEKEKGYNGDTTLNTVFYNNITYGGNYVRNLHPVQGADGVVDELYLLSNRNFDLSNDSIFVGHIQGTSLDTQTSLNVAVYKSNLNYGVPPNGRQFDTDLMDTTSGLQTNDARVLGAIKINDNIQFVSTTVNPATGYSGIYHGKISNIADQPIVSANIIGDTVKDFAYPNIAWLGNEECDIETVIGFNYTSFTDFPGTSCVYYDNDGNYSEEKVIKGGANYVDRLSGTYERWGDYYGMQRMYAKTGSAFSFGFYTLQNKRNTGWCAELITPDPSKMRLNMAQTYTSSSCAQQITIDVDGGLPPYSYVWDNDINNSSPTSTGICLVDSVTVTVTDSRGCSINRVSYKEIIPLEGDNNIYPNPFSTNFSVQFTLDADRTVIAKIYDLTGRLVTDLIQRNARKGLNELVFSLTPLAVGNYVLKIDADGEEILNEKISKYE